MLTVTEALEKIIAAVPVIQDQLQRPLNNALGYVLAQAALCQFDVPPYANAAMDGYAVRGMDLPPQGERAFKQIGKAFAGQVFHTEVKEGECVRIMTGAALPPGADTVVMQEQVRVDAAHIYISSTEKPGQHVRPQGEEWRRGDIVLTAGTRLGAAEIGLLAGLGYTEVRVIRPLRVAFFSTGDELQALGAPLGEGQIYDSNRYTLHALLQRMQVEPLDLGRIADDPQAVEHALRSAAAQADVVITSGGVSVGEADYVGTTIARIGKVNFWKIAMKPGHPLTFGQLENAVFFGLPGNPVSMMVTFYQFLRPALRQMQGACLPTPLRLRAHCLSPLKKKPGRLEFQRGIVRRSATGGLEVTSSGAQNSAMLTSMSRANAFIVLPAECGSVASGSEVEVELFDMELL
jgi:molybdopterin molybdotransferase